MGAPLEVLLVDESAAANALEETLSRAESQFRVETAASASDALDCLNEREYDAVVSDYHLPKGDGLDILTSIRLERESDIPFILFTSETGAETAIEALNLGADRYVRKRNDPKSSVPDLIDVLLAEIEDYHAEQRLLLYRDVVEQLDDPVMLQNRDGEFEVINQAVADYASMSTNDLLGADEYAFMDEEAADTIASNKAQVIETESALRYEIRPSFPHRGEEWFSTLRYPHYDENGRVDGTVAICRDVSELKYSERELKRERDRLEEFASFVSHDLRNPLNVANGRLELVREDCDSPHLDDIEGELKRMDDLITDLLSLAQQGEVVGELEPVRLQECVTQCWNNVDTRDSDLVVDDIPTIRADPNRLTTLLENLFRNADQHGGDDVTVTVGGLEGGFYVADDGPGIPPDERESVFESGYSTDERGTGFGLTIVRQIVGAHGWEIKIADSERGGAWFEITGVEVAEK
ncbi:ATP-binding response regulator [Halapricum desulfuricans]|uniref:ATP-binding response regulator n=1 Tax=Halapricum desulfuricans TaxID=2841257 RepID=UPI001E59526E|nr:ATP-binding protein [Halapricum desulfuricans]